MIRNVILHGEDRKAAVLSREQYEELTLECYPFIADGDTRQSLEEKGIASYPPGFVLCEVNTWGGGSEEGCRECFYEEFERVGVPRDEVKWIEKGMERWKDLWYDSALVLVEAPERGIE